MLGRSSGVLLAMITDSNAAYPPAATLAKQGSPGLSSMEVLTERVSQIHRSRSPGRPSLNTFTIQRPLSIFPAPKFSEKTGGGVIWNEGDIVKAAAALIDIHQQYSLVVVREETLTLSPYHSG